MLQLDFLQTSTPRSSATAWGMLRPYGLVPGIWFRLLGIRFLGFGDEVLGLRFKDLGVGV